MKGKKIYLASLFVVMTIMLVCLSLVNIQAKEENVLVTTESSAEIVVGSKTYNTTEDNLTVTIPVSEGDVKIVARGANIVNVDCGNTLPTTHILPIKELVLRNTSAAEVAIDAPLLERITVVSDENNNVAAVSVASDLSQGVQVVVEKTIKTPVTKADGTTPTIFNFLSMPFEFDCGLNIEYWDGDSCSEIAVAVKVASAPSSYSPAPSTVPFSAVTVTLYLVAGIFSKLATRATSAVTTKLYGFSVETTSSPTVQLTNS